MSHTPQPIRGWVDPGTSSVDDACTVTVRNVAIHRPRFSVSTGLVQTRHSEFHRARFPLLAGVDLKHVSSGSLPRLHRHLNSSGLHVAAAGHFGNGPCHVGRQV